VWDGAPAGVVSVTPYKLGAFGANHALRQTFVFLNMPVMQQPEAYIGGAAELFGKSGRLKSKETQVFLGDFMARFAGMGRRDPRRRQAHSLRRLPERRSEAAATYTNGDPGPLSEIITRSDPATFFPTQGQAPHGRRNRRRPLRQGRQDLLQGRLEPAGDPAIGIERRPRLLERPAARPGQDRRQDRAHDLRITEVFRFEDGDWKLVHRHADMGG
jgi:hypothetical protein